MTEDPTIARRPIDDLVTGLTQALAVLREERDALQRLADSRADDNATLRVMVSQTLHLLHRVERADHDRRMRDGHPSPLLLDDRPWLREAVITQLLADTVITVPDPITLADIITVTDTLMVTCTPA